jgi:TRAP-type mannitol/chloroaromatic compound transport system permease small subunit
MPALLNISRTIDAGNEWIGRKAAWLVLVACVVSVVDALVRSFLGTSSNAWIELQWLLFSAVFLLAAPWTLKSNEHIRIDIVNQRLSKRTRNWIELIGNALFLIPVAALILWTAIPFAMTSIAQREGSSNFGGLPQWPLKLLIPVAFGLLLLQGISELIKRIAIMLGELVDPADDALNDRASHPSHDI